MDDTHDRAYSRAPQLEDLVSLCRSLNEQGVRYLLIGGFAVILHGSVRGTKDIDFLVETSKENIAKLKNAMSVLPDNAVAEIADDDVQKYQVVRVADEIVVDLMARACGIDYAMAFQDGIDLMTVDGVQIPVASKGLLIRMKGTFRASDKSDIGFLRIKIEEELKVK